MELYRILFNILCFVLVDNLVVGNKISENSDKSKSDTDDNKNYTNIDNVFNSVYTECFMHLSYTCIQKKTLIYLKELNKLSEVSVIGNYVKFVKLNKEMSEDKNRTEDYAKVRTSRELSLLIDKSVDRFFNNHIINFSIMGRNISVPHTVDEFVGRKRRKGGGSGGGGGGHGGDDGGKKKMMMMAMMCMKMKMMMVVPAMMGMMGMMSFKGMMFSMMSFMIAKMMLLMKLLEKKGGGGGSGGGGADGGWAAGGGSGGAWMPAGGQDYAGGGGGGYDANAQWQSRSILENIKIKNAEDDNYPMISYAKPVVRYNHIIIDNDRKSATTDKFNSKISKVNESDQPKSRNKRSIIDIIQNSYLYWMNKIWGTNNNRRTNLKYPKFRIVNGVKYIYQPYRAVQRQKPMKEQVSLVKTTDDGFRPIITAEDFNKGEIVEGSVESRMNRKKFHKMKDSVNDTMDDNPWE